MQIKIWMYVLFWLMSLGVRDFREFSLLIETRPTLDITHESQHGLDTGCDKPRSYNRPYRL